MRTLLALIALITLSACGKGPMRVGTFSNFPAEQNEMLSTVFADLKADLNNPSIITETDGRAINVILDSTEFVGEAGKENLASAQNKGDGTCEIHIGRVTMEAANTIKKLKKIIYHEVGHCAELPHTDDATQIMYTSPTRTPFEQANPGFIKAMNALYGKTE